MLTKVSTYQVYNNIPYTRGVVIHIDENEAIIAKFIGRKERKKTTETSTHYDSNIILLTSKDNPYLLKHYEHEEMVFVRCQYNGRIEGIEEIEWVEVSPLFEVVRNEHINHKQLQLLDKYLMETPREELDKIRDEFLEKSKDAEGPTVDEYFEALGDGISRKQLLSFVSDILSWISKENIKYNTQIPGNGNWYDKTGEGIATSNEELINLFINTVYDKEGDN